MKEVKVEGLIYYTKATLNIDHIIERSTGEIQEKLDEYRANGWTLKSTDAASFGFAMYVWLYFEK